MWSNAHKGEDRYLIPSVSLKMDNDLSAFFPSLSLFNIKDDRVKGHQTTIDNEVDSELPYYISGYVKVLEASRELNKKPVLAIS